MAEPKLIIQREGVNTPNEDAIKFLDRSGTAEELWISGNQLKITNRKNGTTRKVNSFEFRAWDNSVLTCNFDGSRFLVALSTGTDTTVRYKSWDQANWSAYVAGSQVMTSMTSPSVMLTNVPAGPQYNPNSSMMAKAVPVMSMQYPPHPQPLAQVNYPPQPQMVPAAAYPSPVSSMQTPMASGPGAPYMAYSTPMGSSQSFSGVSQLPSSPVGPQNSMYHTPAQRQPPILQSVYRFKHQRQFAAAGHEDVVLHYKSWDDSDWTARLANGMFLVTRAGSNVGQTDSIINYRAWDGSNWTARLTSQDGAPAFYHVKQYSTTGHIDKALQYKTWDGSCWMTTIVPDPAYSVFLQ